MTKCGKPRLKRMRRVGSDLSLTSGIRPLDSKCKIGVRPGVHGAKRTRLSNYAINLRSKQAVQFSFRILNKQLYNYHVKAVRHMKTLRKQGKEADYGLFGLLESRLDVIVWRIGFATTLAGARQLVGHRHVFVDDVLQNIPSFSVKPGAVIEVRVKKTEHAAIIQAAIALAASRPAVNWVSRQENQTEASFKGTFIRQPHRDELSSYLKDRESEVIQFYSK